ncbi:hypothetical protein ACFLR2_01310 [Chlamydiota bacterium]
MTAAATRCTFASCLNTSSSYFTNPKSKLATKCGNADFLDKILKASDPLFDLAGVIASSQGASEGVVQGIGKGRALAKAGRDATAFFNIFNGVIAALVINMKNIYNLAMGLCVNAEVTLRVPDTTKKEKPKHTDKVSNQGEKWAALGENFGKGLGAATYTLGFGVCRPIATFEKYISKNINPTASKIGKAFPTVMMVNHIGGVIGSGSSLIFQKLAFNRLANQQALLMNNGVDAVLEAAREEYHKKTAEAAVGFAEKGCELIADIFHHAGVALPAPARIPLQFAIGALSVTKIWLKD